ncbi:EXS-domain-containing protein, partial [Gonapodya prolifera JEL478]
HRDFISWNFDFFVTDNLNSITFAFTALQAFVCAYANSWANLDNACPLSNSWTVAAFTAIPAFLRLVQCVRRFYDSRNAHPHLTNSVKYILALCVIFTAAWSKQDNTWTSRSIWIAFCFLSSTYSCTWDIWFDWGLLRANSKHRFLREELMYPPYTYYIAIILNSLLRVTWVFSISPAHWGILVDGRVIAFFLAMLEVFRRFQWNIIRLENEHSNNVGNFRAVKEIPLPLTIHQRRADADSEKLGHSDVHFSNTQEMEVLHKGAGSTTGVNLHGVENTRN